MQLSPLNIVAVLSAVFLLVSVCVLVIYILISLYNRYRLISFISENEIIERNHLTLVQENEDQYVSSDIGSMFDGSSFDDSLLTSSHSSTSNADETEENIL